MCREHVDLEYLRREAEERIKERERQPAPVAGPAGGLVAVLRGLFQKLPPAKTTVPAE